MRQGLAVQPPEVDGQHRPLPAAGDRPADVARRGVRRLPVSSRDTDWGRIGRPEGGAAGHDEKAPLLSAPEQQLRQRVIEGEALIPDLSAALKTRSSSGADD